jgi:hypothetical protein
MPHCPITEHSAGADDARPLVLSAIRRDGMIGGKPYRMIVDNHAMVGGIDRFR